MVQSINIRFFNRNIDFIGEVSNFTSLIFVRKWESFGKFEITVSKYDKNLFIKENIIMINNDPYRTGVIEEINATKDKVKLIGFTLGFWLTNRVTVPPLNTDYDTYYDTAENIMKQLVIKNAINPQDFNRKIENLISGPYQARGELLRFQSRYKNLADELESISNLSGLGWDIYLDYTNKKFVFEVFEATNRTAQQALVPPVIFSIEYDNIKSREYITSTTEFKNMAYIAGQGEGADRQIEYINNNLKGLDRRELFIDARDIEENESLVDRGLMKLSEFKTIDNLECEVVANGYREEWELGDKVTVIDREFGYLENSTVLEVTETYEDGEIVIEPILGNRQAVFTNKLKQILNTPITETTKSITSKTMPPATAKGTEWLKIVKEE